MLFVIIKRLETSMYNRTGKCNWGVQNYSDSIRQSKMILSKILSVIPSQIMSRNVSADSMYVIVMNCIAFVQTWGLKYASSSFFPIASHTYHVKPHANKSHFDSNHQDTCPAAAFLMTTRLLQALETPLGK